MPRKRKRYALRHIVTEQERWRICMLAEWGFHHKLIARRLWGNNDPNYVPSPTEIARVSRVCCQEEVSTRDWRNGETTAAKSILTQYTRATTTKRLKVKFA